MMSRKTSLPFDVQARMDLDHVPGIGISVFQEGRMEQCLSYGVMEAGTQNKVTTTSLFHACSISKMVTALGVLRLVQKGVLDLEEDVNRYLVSWRVPENEYTQQKKVTLRNLLGHQAGFVDPEGSFDIYQEQDPLPNIKSLLTGTTRYNPEPLQVTYVPESQFSYSDAGFCVIEQLVEDVTGESFAAVMEKLVISPLGLQRTAFLNPMAEQVRIWAEIEANAAAGHDQVGRIVKGKRAYYPYLAGAGLWTTPTELAMLTLELMAAWNGDTQSILRPDLARLMLTGSECDEAVGLGVFVPQDENEPYLVSKGWGVGFQSMLLAYPRLQSGIVVMTNSDPGKPQNEAVIGEVIRQVGKAYDWPGFA
jgi:CubicO group peptidase (beta-lactamase class C family)